MRINMEGARAISQLLKDFVYLKSLHLVDVGLDSETLREICNGISDTMSLEYLDLRQNIFGKQGLKSLIKSLEKTMSIRHLFLESMEIHLQEAKLLSNFIRREECMLEELEINEADINVEAIDEIMEALYSKDTLRRLSLSKNELDLTMC